MVSAKYGLIICSNNNNIKEKIFLDFFLYNDIKEKVTLIFFTFFPVPLWKDKLFHFCQICLM